MSSGYNLTSLKKVPITKLRRPPNVWIIQQEFSGLIIGVASNQKWAKCLANIYKEAGADKDNYLIREFRVTANSLLTFPSLRP